VFAKIEKYFGGIPSRPAPAHASLDEKPQTAERRSVETDKLAKVPAIAIGYRMPPPKTKDAVVAAVTGELLHNGEASRLYQALVKEDQVAISVEGGVDWPLGTPLEYNGPTLMTSLILTPPNKSEAEIVAAYDNAIAALAKTGPDPSELARVKAKMRSDLYDELEVPIRRASMLSHAVLFDGTIDRVATAPKPITSVTADDVRAFAAKTLVITNRTIVYRAPETSKAAGTK